MPDLLRLHAYPVWLQLLLLIFALYRATNLVSREEGPYVPWLYREPEFQTGVLEMMRQRLGVNAQMDTSLARGVSCPLCVGVYLAPVLVALWFVPWLNWLVLWLGIAGGQEWLHYIERGS